MPEYAVAAHRVDVLGSLATSKQAQIVLDTHDNGRRLELPPTSVRVSGTIFSTAAGLTAKSAGSPKSDVRL